MRRFLAGMLVTVGVVTVVGQLALPRHYAGRTENRLEEGGGSARVSIGALPALSLLGGRGGSLEVGGSGLSFGLEEQGANHFERLDGFEEVDVELEDVEAGPLEVETFELARDGRDDPYALVLRASTTPTELAEALGARAGGAVGGLVGSLATEALPGHGRSPVPLELRAEIGSEEGRADVRRARGLGGRRAGRPARRGRGGRCDRPPLSPPQPRSSASRNSLRSRPPV